MIEGVPNAGRRQQQEDATSAGQAKAQAAQASGTPFQFGNIVKNSKVFRPNEKGLKEPVICYGKGKKIGFLEKSEITKNVQWVDNYKVFAPYANNIGTELNDDNLNAFVGEPKSICTETFLVMGADLNLNEISAKNLSKYFYTKFVRFMHSLIKASQHGKANWLIPHFFFNSLLPFS